MNVRTERALLRCVNNLRKQIGLRPVRTLKKGDKKSPWHCPIANTIRGNAKSVHCNVGEVYISIGRPGFERIIVQTPDTVERFITNFDYGNKYDELEVKP